MKIVKALGIVSWILLVNVNLSICQNWQQYAHYSMDIDFDVEKHQYIGKQSLVYQNNSPDTLHRLFFHLYMNAFQPGSMMDVRSRTVPDPDYRIRDRINLLKEDEIGFQRILVIRQGKNVCQYVIDETIMEVKLEESLRPGESTEIYIEYLAQVPLQVRRMGRDNFEKVDYSMAQWYPKVCAYDEMGWHTNPYVSKEFYSPFGNYEVNITIDSQYVLAGTGQISNNNEVGKGYQDEGFTTNSENAARLTWNFRADMVHDFVWPADPEFKVVAQNIQNGPVVYYVYQETQSYNENVDLLRSTMQEVFDYANANFGKYPYPSFAFIQGGDGGMEYPMATLMTFNRTYGSFLGTAYHEILHAWYHGIIANNELLYGWMDEGFSDFTTDLLWSHLAKKSMIPGAKIEDRFGNLIIQYTDNTQLRLEEPLSLHADHFRLNYTYYHVNYAKGQVFLIQLMHMVGEKVFKEALLEYFEKWKFRHPKPNDFIRIVEQKANMNLDWYLNYWINTTNEINYAVDSIFQDENFANVEIVLSNRGEMPMPIDVYIEYEDQTWEIIHIPLRIMRGAKEDPEDGSYFSVYPDWPWTHPYYIISFETKGHEIQKVIIDPLIRIADMDRSDNVWQIKVKEGQ